MTTATIPSSELSRPGRALPNFMAYLLVPPAVLSALHGGWTVLLAKVPCSQFRSEHLLGHHRHVGTPRNERLP